MSHVTGVIHSAWLIYHDSASLPSNQAKPIQADHRLFPNETRLLPDHKKHGNHYSALAS
jgi:hypothetical protein